MTRAKLIEELKDELGIATGIYKHLFEDFKLDQSGPTHYKTGYSAGQIDILQYVLERLEELE